MIKSYVAYFVFNKPWHRQQQNNSITDVLTYLKLPNLEDQRKASHLILLFKIRKFIIVPDCCLPASAPLESIYSHHSLKVAHIQSRRSDIYKHSFLPRMITSYME